MKRIFALVIRAAFLVCAVSAVDSRDRPVEREVYSMGTTLRASLFAADRGSAIGQLELVFAEIENAEKQLSTWLPESEVSLLNKQSLGNPFTASPSLFELMQSLERFSRQTAGYFDPAIGRLTAAWKIHDGFTVPTAEQISAAVGRSGMRHFLLNEADRTITKNSDVLLDVGGFGKGVGLDRGMRVARERRLGALLLDFGGHVAVSGAPPEEQGWLIEIADARNRMFASAVAVRIASGSLSTTGGSERDGFQQGRRISHILNPLTGYPVDSFGSVTVWRERGLDADVLSTALYAMGPDQGFAYATEQGIAACFLVVSQEGTTIRMTPNFQRLTTKTQR